MKRLIKLLAKLIGLIVIGLVAVWLMIDQPWGRPDFPRGQITIVRADGQKFPFDAEIATTPEQEEYGLMHRHSLADNAGMLFIYDPPATISMWMKDTPIALDMLFIRPDGRIEKIVTNTVPFDVTQIPSVETVKGTIELKAGTAEKLGLKTGDRLIYPGFE